MQILPIFLFYSPWTFCDPKFQKNGRNTSQTSFKILAIYQVHPAEKTGALSNSNELKWRYMHILLIFVVNKSMNFLTINSQSKIIKNFHGGSLRPKKCTKFVPHKKWRYFHVQTSPKKVNVNYINFCVLSMAFSHLEFWNKMNEMYLGCQLRP